MKKLLLTLAIGFFPFISSLAANGTFKKVTDTSTLKAGDQIIVVANSTAAMGAQNGTYRSVVTVTKSDNITDPKDVAVVTLESSGNPDYPFYLNAKEDNGSNGYIGVTAKGKVTTSTEIPTDATTLQSYSYKITAAGFTSAGTYSLQLNNSASPKRFAGYAGTQMNATPYILVGSKDPAGLAFPQESYSNILGEAFQSPVLTNPYELAVTYASENTEVATVDESGNVTIVGAGTTTISATSEETDKYAAGSASYTLTVIDPNAPVPTDATFDFTKANAYNIHTNQSTLTKENLSIAEGIVSLGYEYNSGSGYRIYNSTTGYELRIQAGKDGASAGNLTISVPENYLISSIEFDGEAVGVFEFTYGKYTVSNKIGTWSPENGKYNTVTATINNQAKVRTIKVSYVELKPAKEPVVSHNKNQVTITHEEEGAKIYYTVDGSDVDVTNATLLYGGPFAITETTTVKAVAVVEGKPNSAQHVYVAEYIAAPTATWESTNTTVEHHQSGVLNASTMSLDGIHGGIIITITAPEGCALWYSLTQGESNPITKAPVMKANEDNDFTAVDVRLTKVESGKVENVLVQKQGKLTYYTEDAKGKQSHDVVVNFTGETGVEDIIADENNGEVEYFNLQGVRVANPENGVYIRRQGNIATKVLVK